MPSPAGENLRFGARGSPSEELRQSILCLLEISGSGRTATMLCVITGRAKKEVVAVLDAMSESGEVALEELPGTVRATITPAGAGRLRAELGGMMILPRLLVEYAWGADDHGK